MPDASRDGSGSIRELLLGMGGSSMRKSYYPELRSKLDSLELFRELVDRSSDAIMLFSLPEDRLIFANLAAREAFGIGEDDKGGQGIRDLLSAAALAGYPSCLDGDGDGDGDGDDKGCPAFIQETEGSPHRRRFEVLVNDVEVTAGRYAILVARDSTGRLEMEERIRRNLAEKETMLREIHHRVKNNFQLMKSMLSLEASAIADEKARLPLIDSENRIMSMAGVHEMLYQSEDLAKIQAGAYFGEIVTNVRMNFLQLFPAVDISLSCAELSLPLETAMPCGLIVNELLSNCIKHAFPEDFTEREGGKRVSVLIGPPREGRCSIVVRDNGIGVDESGMRANASTVGLMLVNALASQLGGEASWRSDGGTEALVSFPLADEAGAEP
jgi:two-component system, sensor histidine kinase PdtaS